MTPVFVGPNIAKTAELEILATIANLLQIVSSLLWGSKVGYPSDSLVSCQKYLYDVHCNFSLYRVELVVFTVNVYIAACFIVWAHELPRSLLSLLAWEWRKQWRARKFATLVDVANQSQEGAAVSPPGDSDTHHSSPIDPRLGGRLPLRLRLREDQLPRRCAGDLRVTWGEDLGHRSRWPAALSRLFSAATPAGQDNAISPGCSTPN